MSSFGSSVINKSSKKLAPKVPTQRRRPADQTHPHNTSSTPERVSVEATSQRQPEVSKEVSTNTHIHVSRQDQSRVATSGRNIEEPPNKRRRVGFIVEEKFRRGEQSQSQSYNRHSEQQGSAGDPITLPQNASLRSRRTDLTHSTTQTAPSTAPRGAGVAASTTKPSKRAVNNRLSAAQLVLQASIAETQVARRTRSQLAAIRRDNEADNGFVVVEPSFEGSALSSGKKRPGAKKITNAHVDTEPNETNQPEEEIQTVRKKGKRRAMTPPGAEDIQIDPSSVRMADLGKDNRTGKKSRLEAAFQAIDWSEVSRKRKEAEAAALLAAESNAQTQAATASVDARLEQAGQATTNSQHRGPQLKLVNGEMVIDNSSLTIDRHADTASAATALPEEEASNLTARVNTRSWIYDNRRDPSERHRLTNKSDPWTVNQTSAFYDALRMFGTDFYIISKMFPGKTRRHIKLKFVREERANPARIRDALIGGSIPMDLDAYCEATGKERDFYKDPGIIAEDLRQEAEEQKAEINRQREEAAKAARDRKEEARRAKEAKSARVKRNRAKGFSGKTVGTTLGGHETAETVAEPS